MGSRKSPLVRGRTKVRKALVRVITPPAMIFASRFALNGSSRHATIMAMGISIKTAEPSRAHCGRCGAEFGEPTKANRASTSAYRFELRSRPGTRIPNIIAGGIMTLANGFLTFVLPLTNGDFRDPVYPAYVFSATIETVCTSVIIWRAWTWSGVEAAVSSERIVHKPEVIA